MRAQVIIAIMDNWQSTGGVDEYVSWTNANLTHGDFYTNNQTHKWCVLRCIQVQQPASNLQKPDTPCRHVKQKPWGGSASHDSPVPCLQGTPLHNCPTRAALLLEARSPSLAGLGMSIPSMRCCGVDRYKDYVKHLVTRVNTINGRRYNEDSTIFGAL